MHPADTEAAVIVMGCGPAGAGAALWLARRGIDVIVLDRGDEPGTRIESLPPDGIRLGDELGLAGAIDDSTLGAVAEMQLYWRDVSEIRSFDADRAPLLLSKPGFHAAVRRAVRDAGARVFRRTIRSIAAGMDGVEISTEGGSFRCSVAIDARGRASLRRRATDSAPPLFAVHFQGSAPLPSGRGTRMLLEAMQTGWIWGCRHEGGRVAGCLFTDAPSLRSAHAAREASVAGQLAQSTAFGEATEIRIGSPVDAGQLVADPLIAAGQIIAVGDAAIARDPVAAHGLVHALRSGAQAAAAAATLTDKTGAHDAALAFVRQRHAAAASAAHDAVGAAYAGQSRRTGTFWSARAGSTATASVAPLGATPEVPVGLASGLTQMPVLDQTAIRWAAALALPRSASAAAYFGPISASEISALLGTPATPRVHAARLASRVGTGAAFRIIDELLQGGALIPVSALPRDARNASVPHGSDGGGDAQQRGY